MNTDEFPVEIVSRPKNANESENEDELLLDHSKEVSKRIAWLGRFESTSSKQCPSGESVARCLGWLHDFGKVAPAFQQYVRDEYPEGKKIRYTYHARLGAFAAYHALGQMGATERDKLAACAAVLRHHGRLPDLAEQTLKSVNDERFDEGRADWAGPQVEEIKSHAPSREVAGTLLENATNGAASWESFCEAFESGTLFGELARTVSDGPSQTKASSQKLPDDLYDRVTRLWSSLTFADKTAAGQVGTEHLVPDSPSLDRLDEYVESLQKESGASKIDVDDVDPTDEASLNVLREQARQRVRANVLQLADAEVGTLTLPTGLGKTFAGITGAFELRDKLAESRDRETKPTVVYALPYTSIIEQTREIFEDEEIFDADPWSNEFTVHHYLANTVTYTDAEEDPEDGEAETDVPRSKAELLGESWRSGVVLTTFVQLFESLAGPTNAEGLKLPALRDAVIILDEPQALPNSWWDGVRRLARLLLDEYDARIISMTATQPTLFTEGDFATRSLLEPPGGPSDGTEPETDSESSFEHRTFETAARVRYDVHESIRAFSAEYEGVPISHPDAAAEIADSALQTATETVEGRSVLSVCNTIGSSRKLTECLEDEFRSRGHVSTHVGGVYETVLQELDVETSELPDYEELAERTLRELGFEYDVQREEWYADDDAVSRAYLGTFNSRYRPLDRRALIHISDVLSTIRVPFVLVSTQAIEAGVDISFARAYRDVAPLDSVVQTAGRCNRSFEWGPENGEVTVWGLAAVEDDEDNADDGESERKPPARYVYDGSLLRTAAEILLDVHDGDCDTLPAVTLERDAVPRYFQAIEQQSLANQKLVECIEKSNAEELGQYSLISTDYETVDLIVAVTDTDRGRLDELKAAFERRPGEGFENLSELADLRVSIPVRDLEKDLPTHVRADHSERTNSDGPDVFVHRGNEGYGAYKLDEGGFVSDDGGGPSGRFTL